MGSLRLEREQDAGDGKGFIFRTVSDNLKVLTTDKKLVDRYNGRRVWKIGVSVASGCGVGCVYCFTNTYSRVRQLLAEEMIGQAEFVLGLPENCGTAGSFDEIKISFKQMGDPALNPHQTCEAIRVLHEHHPDFLYVVSTSAPKKPQLFWGLGNLVRSGVNIRLQFSCHTTSDEERKVLSPKLSMMSFDGIAEVVRNWPGERVTLNFVVMKGRAYDAKALRQLFDPGKVFVKVNYLDPNSQLAKFGLEDQTKEEVSAFTQALAAEGFTYAFRH